MNIIESIEGGAQRLVEALFPDSTSPVSAGAPTRLAESGQGTPMAATETATITIESPKLANPLVVTLAKEEYPLPVPGTVKVVATSVAGAPTLEEQLTLSADIDGVDLVDNLPLTKSPVDFSAKLGPVLTALAMAIDATITFAVTAV